MVDPEVKLRRQVESIVLELEGLYFSNSVDEETLKKIDTLNKSKDLLMLRIEEIKRMKKLGVKF